MQMCRGVLSRAEVACTKRWGGRSACGLRHKWGSACNRVRYACVLLLAWVLGVAIGVMPLARDVEWEGGVPLRGPHPLPTHLPQVQWCGSSSIRDARELVCFGPASLATPQDQCPASKDDQSAHVVPGVPRPPPPAGTSTPAPLPYLRCTTATSRRTPYSTAPSLPWKVRTLGRCRTLACTYLAHGCSTTATTAKQLSCVPPCCCCGRTGRRGGEDASTADRYRGVGVGVGVGGGAGKGGRVTGAATPTHHAGRVVAWALSSCLCWGALKKALCSPVHPVRRRPPCALLSAPVLCPRRTPLCLALSCPNYTSYLFTSPISAAPSLPHQRCPIATPPRPYTPHPCRRLCGVRVRFPDGAQQHLPHLCPPYHSYPTPPPTPSSPRRHHHGVGVCAPGGAKHPLLNLRPPSSS